MRFFALEITMSDKLEQNTEKSKDAPPIIWMILGLVGITLLCLAIYYGGV